MPVHHGIDIIKKSISHEVDLAGTALFGGCPSNQVDCCDKSNT
jgi:hypothetical protein